MKSEIEDISTLIIADKSNSVTEVYELEHIATTTFIDDKYPTVKGLLQAGRWDEVKELSFTKDRFREYLEIYKFKDQTKKVLGVTVYDSDELWQDPQIIDIIEVLH